MQLRYTPASFRQRGVLHRQPHRTSLLLQSPRTGRCLTLSHALTERLLFASFVPMPAPTSHPRDPLHGITLATIVQYLVDRHGWAEMARRIPIRCFMFDPSLTSSLKFLRKTPWAREKVENWFIWELPQRPPEPRPKPVGPAPVIEPDSV